MSLDARFTQLRRSMERGRPGPAEVYQRRPSPRERVSSLKNRLLAMEMAERPNVMAALSRGRPRARQDSYSNGSYAPIGRSRSPFRRRSRSRQRSGSLRRSNSLGRLGRSQSIQSLMSIGSDDGFDMIPRGRSRRGGGRGGFRTRVFTRGSRINPRGGIRKLNMDLVETSRRRRSASLSRLGNASIGGGFRRGRGRGREQSTGSVKARLGVRPGSLKRTGSFNNINVGTRARSRSRSRVGNNARGGGNNRGMLRGRGGPASRGARGRSASVNRRGGGGLNRGGGGLNRGGLNARSPNKRGGLKGNPKGPGRLGGGNRGRGGMRGRGGARGRRGRGGKPTMPTKEDLDNELDSYMSNTKSFLDKQLDQYMAAPPATA